MTGYEALRTGAAWFDLSDRGKIRVTGEDRARLLHAMSTNNVQELAVHGGQYTFFLSAQGRILADAQLFNLGDSLLLDTEPELCEKLREHLDKFIIADDVELADETTHWTSIGLEGPNSLARLRELGLPVPDSANAVASWDKGFVLRTSVTGGEGAQIMAPSGKKEALLSQLARIPQASMGDVRTVRLENGKPRYGEDITERFLVQETGLLHAVHFSKGCYIGQEIVERVRSRAQIHRHLKPLRITADKALAGGTKLTRDSQPAGEITSSAFSPAWNAVAALAYVRTDASAPQTQLAVAESEPAISAEVL